VLKDESGEPSRMVGVNIDVTERKLAEQALAEMTRKLIEAQEQERARIGRELHDDINQRLALLVAEMEAAKQSLPNSREHTTQLLSQLQQRVIEISSDVQSVSHQLHSSQLEILGIVSGMRSFCREFAARQKVEVDFTSGKIPNAVSNEIALCLFRILQEALHNAVKHSHVRHFEVKLDCSENQLQLTIVDRGTGFDSETIAKGTGLGLVSMRERVRLANGTIVIDSKPMGGTTIHVRVPCGSESFSQQQSASELLYPVFKA